MCDHRALSARLQVSGNALVEELKTLSGKKDWDAPQFAGDVCRAAFGTALDPEACSTLSDDRMRELIPRVEAALASVDLMAAMLEYYQR